MRTCLHIMTICAVLACGCRAAKHDSGLPGAAAGPVSLHILESDTRTFRLGDAIKIGTVITNSSALPMLEPWYRSEFVIEMQDAGGRPMRDFTPPGQPRFWVPPKPGEPPDYSVFRRIPPGGRKQDAWELKHRFKIARPGDYVVTFKLVTTLWYHEDTRSVTRDTNSIQAVSCRFTVLPRQKGSQPSAPADADKPRR